MPLKYFLRAYTHVAKLWPENRIRDEKIVCLLKNLSEYTVYIELYIIIENIIFSKLG